MENSRQDGHDDKGVLKGMAAGLIGGLVASWTMNQFQAAWSKAAEGIEKSHGAQSLQPADQGETGGDSNQSRQNKLQQDDATMKTAAAISEGLFNYKLTKSERETAGTAVHYAFGAVTGALYGAVAELAPDVTVCAGTVFGAAVWAGADEGALPALGLSKGPTEYPLSTHAYSLASHLVYGLTAEAVRRAIRARM